MLELLEDLVLSVSLSLSLSLFPSSDFLGEGDMVTQAIQEAQQLLRGQRERERDGTIRPVSQRLKKPRQWPSHLLPLSLSLTHTHTHTHI